MTDDQKFWIAAAKDGARLRPLNVVNNRAFPKGLRTALRGLVAAGVFLPASDEDGPYVFLADRNRFAA